MLNETRYKHIMLNEDHVPMLTGTTMKVVELVLGHLAYYWDHIIADHAMKGEG